MTVTGPTTREEAEACVRRYLRILPQGYRATIHETPGWCAPFVIDFAPAEGSLS